MLNNKNFKGTLYMVVMKEVDKALEKDFRVGDHFDVAASKLVIGIVGYCIEKKH